ncbi:MAG: heavy metal-associated domain-containing protein [Bacteroidia bacterium]
MENSIKHTYHIGGMGCGGCATTVKNKLSAAPWVTSVEINLERKQAHITSSEVLKTDTLQKVLSNTGYTIAELRAPISL